MSRGKRKRPAGWGSAGAAAVPAVSPEERRRRKDEASKARTRARARVRRASLARRLGIGFVSAGIVLGAIAWFVLRSAPHVSAAALAAGRAAGCSAIETPDAGTPARTHLQPGQSTVYPQEPATSGAHDPAPLLPDPHVYTSPVSEVQAVHNLEHAYVLIYYWADGQDALPAPVIQALAGVANSQFKVIMAPHPQLPLGTALALAAWNKLWTCPASVGPDQSTTIALGFIRAYRGSPNAPEPSAP